MIWEKIFNLSKILIFFVENFNFCSRFWFGKKFLICRKFWFILSKILIYFVENFDVFGKILIFFIFVAEIWMFLGKFWLLATNFTIGKMCQNGTPYFQPNHSMNYSIHIITEHRSNICRESKENGQFFIFHHSHLLNNLTLFKILAN
mgnify:CR=1 FL=1